VNTSPGWCDTVCSAIAASASRVRPALRLLINLMEGVEDIPHGAERR